MVVLALDTTTHAGSAAVVRDRDVLAEHSGDPDATHGQRLPRDLASVLERAGVAIEDVDLFAVAAGPGSFTGLRIGIATIQGLAMARARRVVPVSTLDALAHAARGGERHVAAWMDAQRGEIFAALYDRERNTVLAPSSLPPEATIRAWQAAADLTSVECIGDGAIRYRDVLARLIPSARVAGEAPPLAGVIGRIAAEHPERAVLPHAVVPVYIRRPDAELAKLKKA